MLHSLDSSSPIAFSYPPPSPPRPATVALITYQAFLYALKSVLKPGDSLRLATVIRPSISPVGDAITGGSLPIG